MPEYDKRCSSPTASSDELAVSAIPGFPQKNNAEVGYGRWWIAPTRWGNSNRTGDSGPMAGSRASILVVHSRTVLGFATKMRKSLPPFR
jgi:hypothetical protein